MLSIDIPGTGIFEISHLVLDFNGTLAKDGELILGVAEKTALLEKQLKIHVITADTHGTVQKKLADVSCTLHIITPDAQDMAKQAYIQGLGERGVVAIGNGRNDGLMLQQAAIGIGIIQSEGCRIEVLHQADVVCTNILDALDLLLNPVRLQATLRN